MESCPKELEPFLEAHKKKELLKDEELWRMGLYVQAAVSVAVEHNLAGKKAKSKYLKKPLLQELKEKNKPMSEEELQRQRELFVANLEVMKTNFELNH